MVRAATGTSLVAVTQLHPIFVSFAIPQQALAAIRQNQATAPLRVLAYSQDERKELAEGTLTPIDNQVDPNTGTGCA
jgi:multidrug efflux system membrane fusion protein